MEEKDSMIEITEADIARYVHDNLIANGYVPTSDEILDLAKIFFNYLVEKEALNYVEEIEVEEEDWK